MKNVTLIMALTLAAMSIISVADTVASRIDQTSEPTIAKLKRENVALKAKVKRLTIANGRLGVANAALAARIEALEATRDAEIDAQIAVMLPRDLFERVFPAAKRRLDAGWACSRASYYESFTTITYTFVGPRSGSCR